MVYVSHFLAEMNTVKPSYYIRGVNAVVSERNKRLKTWHYCIVWALLDTRPGVDFYSVKPIRSFEGRALYFFVFGGKAAGSETCFSEEPSIQHAPPCFPN